MNTDKSEADRVDTGPGLAMRAVQRILNRVRSAVSQSAPSEGLDVTAYVSRIEQHFGVTIDPTDAGEFRTLGDVASVIGDRLASQGRPRRSDEVWTDVRRITSDEFGVDANELTADVRFVEDLNC